MKFIELEGLSGNVFSFRVDQITIITKKTTFGDHEHLYFSHLGLESVTECTVINIMNNDADYMVKNSYSEVLLKINAI